MIPETRSLGVSKFYFMFSYSSFSRWVFFSVFAKYFCSIIQLFVWRGDTAKKDKPGFWQQQGWLLNRFGIKRRRVRGVWHVGWCWWYTFAGEEGERTVMSMNLSRPPHPHHGLLPPAPCQREATPELRQNRRRILKTSLLTHSSLLFNINPFLSLKQSFSLLFADFCF